MVKRRGGILPLVEGRVGIPLDSQPSHEWLDAFRNAAARERVDDELWQSAATGATADELDGVHHLVFTIGNADAADFTISYLNAFDSAIQGANAQTG